MRHSWIVLLAALTCASQAAEVYQYIDEHGNRVFTDQPPVSADAEKIHIPEVNRTQPLAPATPGHAPVTSEEQTPAAAPYRQLTISGLPADGALRANSGTFEINVHIQPRLARQHKLQLLVDGQPHGQPVHNTLLQATNLERGEHQLAVQVLADEQVVQQSDAYPVSIQRTHLNAPARRRP